MNQRLDFVSFIFHMSLSIPCDKPYYIEFIMIFDLMTLNFVSYLLNVIMLLFKFGHCLSNFVVFWKLLLYA